MKPNKVLSLLGIAMKGKNLVSGEYQTMEAVRTGTAWLVLVAKDASENTKKLFHDKCSFYEVTIMEYGSKEDLGRAIGKDLRSSIAICNEGISKAVQSAIVGQQTQSADNE